MNRRRARIAPVLTVLMLMATGIAMSQTEPLDVETFLRQYIKLTDAEIRQVSEGEAIAKVIDTGEKPEVVIFGGVYIEAPIEDYIKVSRNVKGLEKTENYLAVEVFSDPPKLSDLDRLELPKEDIDSLRDCEVGDCEIQMVATTIATLQKTVNWKSDDRYDEVNALARKELYEGLLEYKKGGLKALGSYRDHEHERNMYDTLKALLNRGDLMPVGASKLFAYLLSYPDASLEGSEDFFYWENVKFGLKPTLRMNHVTIYQAEDHPSHPYVIANKQLYSSHYFQVAVDLSFCVRDAKRDGFYLITIKGSRQHGLTGFTGSIARRVAVGRARDGMEKGLQFMKANLEEE